MKTTEMIYKRDYTDTKKALAEIREKNKKFRGEVYYAESFFLDEDMCFVSERIVCEVFFSVSEADRARARIYAEEKTAEEIKKWSDNFVGNKESRNFKSKYERVKKQIYNKTFNKNFNKKLSFEQQQANELAKIWS